MKSSGVFLCNLLDLKCSKFGKLQDETGSGEGTGGARESARSSSEITNPTPRDTLQERIQIAEESDPFSPELGPPSPRHVDAILSGASSTSASSVSQRSLTGRAGNRTATTPKEGTRKRRVDNVRGAESDPSKRSTDIEKNEFMQTVLNLMQSRHERDEFDNFGSLMATYARNFARNHDGETSHRAMVGAQMAFFQSCPLPAGGFGTQPAPNLSLSPTEQGPMLSLPPATSAGSFSTNPGEARSIDDFPERKVVGPLSTPDDCVSDLFPYYGLNEGEGRVYEYLN